MEARRSVRVVNDSGLHARPCHAVVSTALAFDADLRVHNGAQEANGKSILELMTLNAPRGTELELIARGRDAEALVCALVVLFASGFEETS